MIFKKKRILLTLMVLSLFSLSIISVPVAFGMQDDLYNNFLTTKGLGTYTDSFEDNVYRNGSITSAYGWGSGTISNARNMTWEFLDHFITTDPVVDLQVQGRKVYAGVNTPDLGGIDVYVLDINNPNNIRVLGTSSDHESLTALAVDGDIMFASLDSIVQRAIISYNVTNPFNPAWQVGIGNDNYATDIEIDGHLIYYTVYNAADGKSLRILPITGLWTSFSDIIHCNWESSKAQGLDVKGQLAYIAAGEEGFYILNVTNKYAPVEIGYTNTPGNATDVIVDGHFAYLADGPAGIQIIDVSNPQDPTIIGDFNTGGYAQNLVKKGDTLFVADSAMGVSIFDVANPSNPLFIANIDYGFVSDVDLFGGFLVVGANDGIYTFAIGYQGNFGSDWYENHFDLYQAWDVRIVGDVAYVAAGPDGFYTLNVRNPADPILLDHFPIASAVIKTLEVRGEFAYCIDNFGMYTLDVSDPANIRQTRFEIGTDIEDIAFAGPIAYVAYGDPLSSGFASLNYTYNYNDGFMDNINFGVNITTLCVQGNLIYSGENNGGTSTSPYIHNTFAGIFDPEQIGSYDFVTEKSQDIFVDGDLLYLADNTWLVLFNVSDPFAPNRLGDLRYEAVFIPANGVWADGPLLITTGSNGAYLTNTIDYLATYNLPGSHYSHATGGMKVTCHGDFTYVANKSNLIILRHFKSLASTYKPGMTVAQSLEVDTKNSNIESATLFAVDSVTFGTEIIYYISADGGANWHLVTPGVEFLFTEKGKDLRWKAEIFGPDYRSAYIYEISIEYVSGLDFTSPLMIGIYIGAGVALLLLLIIIVAVSARKKKKTPTR